ncbi:uncharacterized protein LOC141665857 [Apium graveolens]|uniref:uncharacterized protein LOC141665857 n=1 Tax=Apium graveolens TaxID=4045 RepID=UPI003D7928A8
MKKDAFELSLACDKCQRYANYYNSPVAPLTSLMSPWPFAMWGIDLIGELPKAKGGVKYAVIAVDYFTKWAEARSLATITTKKLKEFVHRTILGIQKSFSAVCDPESNGQTEAINKIIKHTLKAKLEEKKRDMARRARLGPMVLQHDTPNYNWRDPFFSGVWV